MTLTRMGKKLAGIMAAIWCMMTTQLVECIPNFSEGRRIEVVDAIVEAITSVEGVILLDRSSDADHNRSVITFVGDLQAAGEAAFRGIAKASTRKPAPFT